MEKYFIISSPENPQITVEATAGHYATSSSHVSHFLDFTKLRHNSFAAQNVAEELARPYVSSEWVDTVICMDGTEVIGAYFVEELSESGSMILNQDHEINIITPASSVSGQLIFQPNYQDMIKNKNIILLLSTVSSGKTLYRAIDCLSYYGGNLIGVSALFSAVDTYKNYDVHSVFTPKDIPGYRSFSPSACEMCRENIRLNAIINENGYMNL